MKRSIARLLLAALGLALAFGCAAGTPETGEELALWFPVEIGRASCRERV